jgi:hypothetical protein
VRQVVAQQVKKQQVVAGQVVAGQVVITPTGQQTANRPTWVCMNESENNFLTVKLPLQRRSLFALLHIEMETSKKLGCRYPIELKSQKTRTPKLSFDRY